MTRLERLREFRHLHEATLAVALLALLACAGALEPAFLRPAVQIELSTHVWDLALLAIPMTLIVITAGIDLSVASATALCAVVLGLSYEAGAPLWLAAAAAVLTGLAAGALNGTFVAFVRVHPLIVTLATLSAYRGVAEGISLGRPVSGFPEPFAVVGRGSVAGALFAVAAVLAAVALSKTPFGRFLYAIGHNETAARHSGIAVDRIKLLLYSLSGAFAGLSAVVLVSRRNTAKADMASGAELDVITAVVLGGTSIFGGKGTIAGTVLGVALIHEVREFVSWRWQRDELNAVVVGVLLVASVLLQRVFAPRARGD
jgi:rhamnose transport system permease protein